MSNPQVPPRPYDDHGRRPSRGQNGPPPLPPIPPALKQDLESEYGSAPHFEDPLVAPRPHKVHPDLPANMARNLHEQATSGYARPSSEYGQGWQQPQQSLNLAPGFAPPQARAPSASPLPPPRGSNWSPWAAASPPPSSGYPSPYPSQGFDQRTSYYQPPTQEAVASSIAALSLGPPQPQQQHSQHRHRPSAGYALPPAPPQSPPVQQYSHAPTIQASSPPRQSSLPAAAPTSTPGLSSSGSPSLTAPLPSVSGLTASLQLVQQPHYDPAQKVAWCRDVLSLINRAESLQATVANPISVGSTETPVGPLRIDDPQLRTLVGVMTSLVTQLSAPPLPKPAPQHIAEVVYLRASCESSGAFPAIKRDPRTAFRDFEYAARNGYAAAWFKIGRDYENFGDVSHAKDAFERGVKVGDERCLYRMGMAYLMGQLGLPPSPEAAVPLLHRAATLASVDVPQPAYVYGLLLLQEFSHISIPPPLFVPFVPSGSTAELEARKHLERAAFLNFAPAQYKLGHSYEFATPPFPFDALLSVQYYSLASQQGEIEADMALSKWFLCGSEGAFEKDEGLAWTFAEKAARKGLPSAEFAMGYYAEVGVGGPKDIESARRWYQKAADHGNEDARERLRVLSQPSPQAISRAEHDTLTETKLVRTRTQAKQRSDATGAKPPPMPATQGARIMENVRKNTVMAAPAPAVATSVAPAPTANAISPRRRPADLPPASAPVPVPAPAPVPSEIPPATQSPRPFANAPRYNLMDPGYGSNVSPRPPAQQSSFGPPGRRAERVSSASAGPPPPVEDRPEPPRAEPPRKGPQTFAEMGITTTKVEEKECIIM